MAAPASVGVSATVTGVAGAGGGGGGRGGLVIYKMTGSGNDFVFVDGRSSPIDDWTEDRIRAVCARGTGVGADGLVVLEPGSQPSAVRFHFFNNDGRRAEMCGNAALCAARLSARLELASEDGICLETDSGLVRTRCIPATSDRAELGLADVTDLVLPEIEAEAGEQLVAFATVGVPHLVVLVDDLEAIDMAHRGRALRRHPSLADAGANVNFVGQDQAGWAMRTYERGVEGETLACGTGAVACGAALARERATPLPWEVVSRSGRSLVVSGTPVQTGLSNPRLEGEGRVVFRGVLDP